MPAQLTYGTAGATGGGFSAIKGLQSMFSEERLDVRPDWSWQKRSAKTWRDRNGWDSLWSFGCKVGGADFESYACLNDMGHGFEPFSCDGDGTQSIKWLLGRCEDASGVAIANATVQAFRTSDDLFCGECVSLDDGSFRCPTGCVGSAHYVVAYKPGSPDIGGTTVNTLTPTNIDGT